MFKHNWSIVLLLLVLLDSSYSFWQHSHVALDGDMAAIILPAPWYQQVLTDPLGLHVLLKNEVYAAPNRFFAHKLLSEYFKTVPLLLQRWHSPIDSIYQACAWLKLAVQVLLIYLLGAYISGSSRILNKRFVLAVALVVPLFQTAGFNNQMGIIDKSITYTVFYALPIGLLLVFLLPFYQAAFSETRVRLSVVGVVLLLLLAVGLALGGPVVPGVVVLVCPAALWLTGRRYFKATAGTALKQRLLGAVSSVPWPMLLCFGLLTLLCLYSLYIGRNNAENMEGNSVSLLERYSRIPMGIYQQLKQKLGLPLLLAIVLLNAYIIKRQPATEEGGKLLTILKWIGWFALVYILLLPLGGYRDYRPYILRRDVIMPVVLALIYFYGISSFHLARHLAGQLRTRYLIGLGLFLVIFMLSDKPIVSDNNACERQMLAQLAESPEKTVRLADDCTVMSWTKTTNPADSDTNAELLHYWNVTSEKKTYYQQAAN
ncbi:hypothetical protein [Hymenobacter cavernae]|uniref:Glycosyltransferase RgtA/B/C/D-like domain-containing protein n=1 Tax=Hymenobacter cavernae TaxID=2044852 RepID=A0ABQ1UEC6_9BACT|nr:hypothetical protein [Hymenobacter cavernae]GGF17074.1 hypothetical protein GCM10011383_30660 [Hymenobacter cavernae]